MESYCVKCKKYTKNINPRVLGTSNGKAVILSKCAMCGRRKLRFIKSQEVKGLLSILGPLMKVPVLGHIFF